MEHAKLLISCAVTCMFLGMTMWRGTANLCALPEEDALSFFQLPAVHCIRLRHCEFT